MDAVVPSWKAGGREAPRSRHQIDESASWVWRMSGLTRDGTAEPISRDQVFRSKRGQANTLLFLFRLPQAGW